MKWDWLSSLLYGALSGFSEFLPISSQAHQLIFLRLTGLGVDSQLPFRLFAHVGALTALLFAYWTRIAQLRREHRLASVPSRKRKRKPSVNLLPEDRFLRAAAVPLLISFVLPFVLPDSFNSLWFVAVALLVNGFLLYMPQFVPTGNKEAASLSTADAMLTGICGGLGRFTGCSSVAAMTGALKIRGFGWQYALQTVFLLCVPMLIGNVCVDLIGLFAVSSGIAFRYFLLYILCALASFAGASGGIAVMRFLSVKAGFCGFSYYCWGTALFAFILYLLF